MLFLRKQKGMTMDIHGAYEIAKKLRNLARLSDLNAYNVHDIILELIAIADDYQDVAEQLEMDMIIQAQRDWVEAN
jgi:hypothetical protein